MSTDRAEPGHDGTVPWTEPSNVPPPPVEWIERTYPGDDDADVETDSEVDPVPVVLPKEASP